MRKKQTHQIPLFGFDKKEVPKEPPKEVTEKPVKKRGRPPKNKQDSGLTQKENTQPKKKNETSRKSLGAGWKDFNKTKPELLQPCEFCIVDDKGNHLMFNAFIKEPGCTITNDPYKLVVLRKRYGNIYYKEIKTCSNVQECPEGFPNCENCKKKKIKNS